MDVLQEIKNTEPTLACKLKLFFDQLARQSTLRITDLNEDCLLEIFKVKSLTLMDLCSVAESCKHFRQVTQRIRPKEFCVVILNDQNYDVVPTNYLACKRRSSHDIERIFKNFGPCLCGISISTSVLEVGLTTHNRSYFVLNLVAQYCVNNVDSLTFASIEIHTALTVKLKPIFTRLKLLVLDRVSIIGDKTLFADLNSLVELRVYKVRNCHAILENTFPKLERFSYAGRNHLLSTFILRHTSLQTVDLYSHMDKRFCAEM